MNASETTPQAYATPLEWLEGKRRFVRILRQFCGWSREPRRRERPVAARPDGEVLTAALSWHEEQHNKRLALTRQAGVKLPIDEFVAELNLDDVEREIVELLLVAATDLADDDSRGGIPTGEMARLLARGREELVQSFLPYFLPGGRLQNTVYTRETPFWEPLRTKWLNMTEDMVARLLGVPRGQSRAQTRSVGAGEAWHGDIADFLDRSGVVLDRATLDLLRAVWGYLRRSKLIREKWGFGALAQTGVCLLFYGPSGTGKTLTARTLCRALGPEPLVVSYPDLVSKWVGETQKNTRTTFAEAARAGRALVFDEADAIFARRTEVRHSTDRFANGEVNTLLMELERFTGLAILTTNHAGVLDPALERRIQYKAYFGPPGADARAKIWRKHLPAAAPLASDVDFDRLAKEHELTGGQIANAVLAAATLAASRLETDSDTAEITMADFEAAARRELAGYGEHGRTGRLGF